MVSALKELLEQNRREAALSKHTSYTLKTCPFSQTCSHFHPLPVAGELMDSSKDCLVPVDWINRLSAEIKGLRTMRSAISPNPPMSSPHLIYIYITCSVCLAWSPVPCAYPAGILPLVYIPVLGTPLMEDLSSFVKPLAPLFILSVSGNPSHPPAPSSLEVARISCCH